MSILSQLLIAVASLGSLATAHPGEDHRAEMLQRREFLSNNAANLAHCTEKLDSLGVNKRSIERRNDMINHIRSKRGIVRRDQHLLAKEYHSDISAAELFKSNASCVLAPDTTEGPYYVAGEYIRSNIVEDQKGVPLHIDVQFINSATCEPVVGSYVDAWQANATGVYGGVVVDENGSGESDQTNWYTTWLRGIQKTDDDGVVQFETIFPGHYHGRTVHIHVMTHLMTEQPSPNNTLTSVRASHVGQMYFDQDLIAEVETNAPYSENEQPLTSNDEDFILQEDIRAGGHPFMQYELLGDSVADGILAWLSFGIHENQTRPVEAITTYHGGSGAAQETQAAA